MHSYPLSFRFDPEDEEVLGHYLYRKLRNKPFKQGLITEADVYSHHPDDLLKLVEEKKDLYVNTAAYFFTERNRKYPNGERPSLDANGGIWKPTAKAEPVVSFPDTDMTGYMRRLAFRKAIAKEPEPIYVKTDWLMHEYTITDNQDKQRDDNYDPQKLSGLAICKVYLKPNGVRTAYEPPLEIEEASTKEKGKAQYIPQVVAQLPPGLMEEENAPKTDTVEAQPVVPIGHRRRSNADISCHAHRPHRLMRPPDVPPQTCPNSGMQSSSPALIVSPLNNLPSGMTNFKAGPQT